MKPRLFAAGIFYHRVNAIDIRVGSLNDFKCKSSEETAEVKETLVKIETELKNLFIGQRELKGEFRDFRKSLSKTN